MRALLTGASLWTVGLFAVAGIVATDMLFRSATFPRFFHGLFINVPVAGTVALLCLVGGVLPDPAGARRPRAAARRPVSTCTPATQAGSTGAIPREVQPLVDDLNALLDHRAEAVRRALARPATSPTA